LGNDHIHHIHNADEVLIHGFSVVLEFQNLSINFVNEQNRSDSFSHSLS
jgi:hypothetical protein